MIKTIMVEKMIFDIAKIKVGDAVLFQKIIAEDSIFRRSVPIRVSIIDGIFDTHLEIIFLEKIADVYRISNTMITADEVARGEAKIKLISLKIEEKEEVV